MDNEKLSREEILERYCKPGAQGGINGLEVEAQAVRLAWEQQQQPDVRKQVRMNIGWSRRIVPTIVAVLVSMPFLDSMKVRMTCARVSCPSIRFPRRRA